MNLYAVVDKKSGVPEYFLASCDQDALRIWFVMIRSSAPMYAFLDEFDLYMVRQLNFGLPELPPEPIFSGEKMLRLFQAREEMSKNAKTEMSNGV